MLKSLNLKNPFHWLLLLLVIGLCLIKYEALSLPFFWDEAWSYLPAIRVMAEKGPSLIPGSIDAELYRGHPLLFYFLSSFWIKTFGYSLTIAHLFPLFISVVLLISVYFITYKWTNSYFAGFLATFLLFIQPIFLTQSTFLLSEIMLGLFFVWAFYFYFKKQTVGFAIALLAALSTKESGYCLIPAFIIILAIEWYFKNADNKLLLKYFSIVLVVFAIGFTFFIIQKKMFGWYFFPLHTSMIDFKEFGNKMEGSLLTLFVKQGRNFIYLITFIAAIVLFGILKNRLSKEHKILLLSFAVITFGFVLFAAINFFTNRYLFAVMPLLLIGCSFVFSYIKKPMQVYSIILIISLIGIFNIIRSINNPNFGDTELSYTKLLKVQIEMVDYVKKSDLKEQIYAPFLMFCIFDNPHNGFMDKKFVKLSSNLNDTNNIFYLNVVNESSNELDSMIANNHIHLVKRFENEQAKVELFKK